MACAGNDVSREQLATQPSTPAQPSPAKAAPRSAPARANQPQAARTNLDRQARDKADKQARDKADKQARENKLYERFRAGAKGLLAAAEVAGLIVSAVQLTRPELVDSFGAPSQDAQNYATVEQQKQESRYRDAERLGFAQTQSPVAEFRPPPSG